MQVEVEAALITQDILVVQALAAQVEVVVVAMTIPMVLPAQLILVAVAVAVEMLLAVVPAVLV
jgi:hypothetical protein